MIESENSEGEVVRFNHPFLQASFMFLGESLCMVVFLITLGFKVFAEPQLFESILSDILGKIIVLVLTPIFETRDTFYLDKWSKKER